MKHNFHTFYKRVLLQPMSVRDSELYRQLRNQNHIRIWFENSCIIEQDVQRIWYNKYLVTFGEYMFSIYDLLGQFIGGVSIYKYNEIEKKAEFGRFIIDKSKVLEKGIGLEATIATLHIAKTQLLLNRLQLEVYENNYAAISTYKKAGFIINGKIKDKKGKDMYSMVRSLV
jgi:RimJ/RimL family protein N-acetyltransferase